MFRILFFISFFLLALLTGAHVGKRGMKGLREKKMVVDKLGNEAYGKEAISVARLYLFLAGLSFALAIFFFVIALILVIHTL